MSKERKSCCMPAAADRVSPPTTPQVAGARHPATARMRDRLIQLPGGAFSMGYDGPEVVAADQEAPARPMTVRPFTIAATTVTNAQFSAFVREARYKTSAERVGWSFVFHLLLPRHHGDHLPSPVATPWWRQTPGASWHAPEGPGSSIGSRMQHPVVHVDLADAKAFCDWADVRLPTEVEWEFAARGGLDGRKYPWGDDLWPEGKHRCNIWQGTFPLSNSGGDGYLGTAPAKSYEPNVFGLYCVSGNVWEWCESPAADRPLPGPDHAILRGGSFLCHDSYCSRYRVSSRTVVEGGSSASNVGFRIAR